MDARRCVVCRWRGGGDAVFRAGDLSGRRSFGRAIFQARSVTLDFPSTINFPCRDAAAMTLLPFLPRLITLGGLSLLLVGMATSQESGFPASISSRSGSSETLAAEPSREPSQQPNRQQGIGPVSNPSGIDHPPAIPRLQVGSAGEMIGFAGSSGTGQIITVIHTGKSWMSVYHIGQTGEIRLASSRPIDADFSLELNATAPLPDDIRRAAGRSKH